MLCDKCKKRPATVHIKKIENGKQRQMDLCSECASEVSGSAVGLFGQQDGLFDSISDMLAGFSDVHEEDPEEENRCSSCGTSFNDFQNRGRMGCPQCCRAFSDKLLALLKRLQGSTQHAGKSPSHRSKSQKIQRLENDLKEAVQKEEYERAAVIRDKIKDLKRKEDESE